MPHGLRLYTAQLPVLEVQVKVRAVQGGRPVADQDARGPVGGFEEASEHGHLAPHVEARGGLVEQDELSAGPHRAERPRHR